MSVYIFLYFRCSLYREYFFISDNDTFMASQLDLRVTVQSWEVCCYHNTLRRWIYGVLSLSPDIICFLSHKTRDSNEALNLEINFSNIKSMKKALSSLMYSAIIITTEDSSMYWFSSLSDSNATFLILQHFYHEYLANIVSHSQDISSNPTRNKSQTGTKLGAQLLQSVNDSQETLSKAAVVLHGQGQQLGSMAHVMENIHQDLNVAQRIVSGLSSWLGRWRIPKVYKEDDLILINDNDIADVFDVKALFTHVSGGRNTQLKDCVFRVGADGMTVLNLMQKVTSSVNSNSI